MKICAKLGLLALYIHQVSCFQSESCPGKSSKLRHVDKTSRVYAEPPPDEGKTRRDLLTQATGLAVSSFLLGQQPVLPALAAEDDIAASSKPLTFVMTGANSGIGFEACKRLSAAGHRIVLACRTKQKALDAIERLGGKANGNLVAAECDLASLASIAAFANELPSLLGAQGSKKIDRLCLNAGLSRNVNAKDCARTADGFELTVGTNHFGHFYLNHLLQSKSLLDKNAHITVTASAVHDPESPGGAQGVPAFLGDLRGLQEQGRDCEMLDGGAFNADKAYKDSKLCNVLFTRELQRRLDASGSGIVVNCFSPGLIVGTGLFRDQNPVFTKLFDIVATDLAKVGERQDWGGSALVYTTAAETKGRYYYAAPGSGKYGDAAFGQQFAPSPVSKEAQDDARARKLWELSEKVLGL